MSHSDFCIERMVVLHLSCCSETAKLVIVVKIVEDIFVCWVFFFPTLSKNMMFTESSNCVIWRKCDSYWIIGKQTEPNLLQPFSSCSFEAFCPYLGDFSKEIKAVLLLQLKVAVVCQLLCMCCNPVFWAALTIAWCFIRKKHLDYLIVLGHGGLRNLEKW